MLEHERVYLKWLEGVWMRYPDLIIENCSSGGLRMDYAMLSRYSIQSTSDQEGYLNYATIAANSPLGVTMEQSAIWSYPRIEGDEEETVFNMVNAMLMRVHQSGHMVDIAPERKALVKEGLDYYKEIRSDIKCSVPFWPTGFSSFADDWVSLGLKGERATYLSVWRRGGGSYMELPIAHLKGREVEVRCAYPMKSDCDYHWNAQTGILTVMLPAVPSARVFELKS